MFNWVKNVLRRWGIPFEVDLSREDVIVKYKKCDVIIYTEDETAYFYREHTKGAFGGYKNCISKKFDPNLPDITLGETIVVKGKKAAINRVEKCLADRDEELVTIHTTARLRTDRGGYKTEDCVRAVDKMLKDEYGEGGLVQFTPVSIGSYGIRYCVKCPRHLANEIRNVVRLID